MKSVKHFCERALNGVCFFGGRNVIVSGKKIPGPMVYLKLPLPLPVLTRSSLASLGAAAASPGVSIKGRRAAWGQEKAQLLHWRHLS